MRTELQAPVISHTGASVRCSFLATCWERADPLALLYVTFSCVFVIFPYGVLDEVWYLIVLIPDLCLLPYFTYNKLFLSCMTAFHPLTIHAMILI